MVTQKLTRGLVAVMLLATLMLPARRAQAIDAWGWAGIGIAAYAVLVVTATTLVYRAPLADDEARLPEREDRRDKVQMGSRCAPQHEPGLVIACW